MTAFMAIGQALAREGRDAGINTAEFIENVSFLWRARLQRARAGVTITACRHDRIAGADCHVTGGRELSPQRDNRGADAIIQLH